MTNKQTTKSASLATVTAVSLVNQAMEVCLNYIYRHANLATDWDRMATAGDVRTMCANIIASVKRLNRSAKGKALVSEAFTAAFGNAKGELKVIANGAQSTMAVTLALLDAAL